MRVVAVVGGFGLAVTSCASLSAECSPTGMSYDGMPVYRSCEVDLPARTSIASSVIPFDAPDGQRCYRAEFELIMDPAGDFVLSSARPIRVSDSTFYRAVITSLTQQRWEPARKRGQPVAQLVRIDRRMSTRGGRVRTCR